MFISLDTVKKHLNIDDYFKDDDEYLTHLILVAEKVVERHIDCDFSVLKDEVGQIPAPLLQSILLFIGNMYQSREAVSFSPATELPLSFRYLLDLYMNYSSDMTKKPDTPKKIDSIKEKVNPELHKSDFAPLEPMRPLKHSQDKHKIEVKNIEVIEDESRIVD